MSAARRHKGGASRRRQARQAGTAAPHRFEHMPPGELLARAATMPPGCAASALRLAAGLRTLAAEAESLAGGVLALLADAPHQQESTDPRQVPGLWAGDIERAAESVQGWRVWGLGREVRHVVGLLALAMVGTGRPGKGGKGGTA
ncbi:hypothetical protein [uncultured Azohydromonas sp.]|jgi:hypothetical protein|uniref:hypothetical protein n=1 Tax=uncultured Azohydromonas sp. TaxID=487342 RepID=UPI00260A75E7|nr:hypothetical protein [uncultured Azohydromonas sp.]